MKAKKHLPEKAMTKKELYAHPGWDACTFEGAEMSTLLLGLKSTFREKLEWLEEAETLMLQLRAAREKAAAQRKGGKPSPPKDAKVTK